MRFNLFMKSRPDQNPTEWKEFILFIESYFNERRNEIGRPIVVEIGTRKNNQKKFYNQLLYFRHIGVDINPKRHPDIVGDSHNKRTWNRLRCQLKHHPIHLLFIDGGHLYADVKQDLKMYGILTSHLIALHDIHCVQEGVEVSRIWKNLRKSPDFKKMKTKEIFHPEDRTFEDMGIGIIIKK